MDFYIQVFARVDGANNGILVWDAHLDATTWVTRDGVDLSDGGAFVNPQNVGDKLTFTFPPTWTFVTQGITFQITGSFGIVLGPPILPESGFDQTVILEINDIKAVGSGIAYGPGFSGSSKIMMESAYDVILLTP